MEETRLVSNCLGFYATVCDFAGVELPAGIEGRSLRPLLSGDGDVSWRNHVVAETHWENYNCDGRMVRTERFKYVAYTWGACREQLFDMETECGSGDEYPQFV